MTDKTITRQLTIDRRQILYLLILGIAFFLLVPKLIGFHHVLRLLQVAHPVFLAMALGAEILRYVFSACSSIVLARLFGIDVPMTLMMEAFFAGAAANRTFSTGGAPGMVVRFDFFTREGLHAGAAAAIFVIEDAVGLLIGGILLLAGVVTLTNALPPGAFVVDAAVAFAIGSPFLVLAGLYIFRRRAWVEKFVHAATAALNRPLEWLLGRTVFTSANVQHALDDFYAGMSLARHSPLRVVAAVLFNISRYAVGIATLFFAFLAMEWLISPSELILIYTAVSVLSSVSAVPGEVAIMGTSFALLSLAFGVPRDVAVLALLLSRAIVFWLPIPVGFVSFWHLRRKQLL